MAGVNNTSYFFYNNFNVKKLSYNNSLEYIQNRKVNIIMHNMVKTIK